MNNSFRLDLILITNVLTISSSSASDLINFFDSTDIKNVFLSNI